jgi:hypothetical protein
MQAVPDRGRKDGAAFSDFDSTLTTAPRSVQLGLLQCVASR